MAIKLLEYLNDFSNGRDDYAKIFEFGCGSGGLTCETTKRFNYKEYILNDLVPNSYQTANSEFIAGDIESLTWPKNLDLVLSGATVQWLENPASLLKQCRESLKNNGFLAISSFAPETLAEVTAITKVGLIYPTVNDWQNWLSNNFGRFKVIEECETMEFSKPIEVLKHLSNTGVTGIKKMQWNKRSLSEFEQEYSRRFSTENGVYLTYKPIYILASEEL